MIVHYNIIDFEMHVMEHFTFEEQETLKYIPPNEENGHDA